MLLDCSDDERRARLANRLGEAEIADALRDARQYRSLGLAAVDTNRSVDLVASEIAGLIGTADRQTMFNRRQETWPRT